MQTTNTVYIRSDRHFKSFEDYDINFLELLVVSLHEGAGRRRKVSQAAVNLGLLW